MISSSSLSLFCWTRWAMALFSVGLGAFPLSAALKGEYFSGRTLEVPLLQRTDPNIAFYWGEGSPDPVIPNNEFSARWTGFLTAKHTETYTLYLVSDNGSRLKLGDEVITGGFDPAKGTEMGWTIRDIHLKAGERVPFELEYYESTGGAEVTLYWYSASQPFEAIAASAFSLPEAPPPAQTGWTARYFDGRQFEKPVLTRLEDAIDYEWLAAPVVPLFADNFSVKWSGLLTPASSETYRFTIKADNGTRLWIDGKLVSRAWNVAGGEDGGWHSVDVPLTAGQPVPVLLDYYQAYGAAQVSLYWSSASQPWALVPGSALTEFLSAPVPWLASFPATASVTGTAVHLPVEASDAQGATLTYSANGLPPGVNLLTSPFPNFYSRDLPALQTVSLSGVPWQPGVYPVSLSTSSSNGVTHTTFLWTVTGPVTVPDLASALALLQANLRFSVEQAPTRFTLDCLLPEKVTRFYEVRLERSLDLLSWENRSAQTEFYSLPAGSENLRHETSLHYQEALPYNGKTDRFFYRLQLVLKH